MAALDGETMPDVVDPASALRAHVASCASCGRWLRDMESMSARLREVSYPDAPHDLWGAVQGRLGSPDTTLVVTHRLWLVGALVLGWRALQLLTDLPFPLLHFFVPLAA